MSGRLITLDKQIDICKVGIGETWQRVFAKIVFKVTGPEATLACQDEQLCTGLKAESNSAINRVQALWDEN